MPPLINRRNFLKLSGLLPLGLATSHFLKTVGPSLLSEEKRQNVVIVIFDAFTAYDISLYGYNRETTPNLARLAERAIVYHNHFSGSNFTTSGTASLLTGTLPWLHRALAINAKVAETFAQKNIFRAFEHYYRIVYSHNPLVNTLLKQFSDNLDDYVPQDRLFLTTDSLLHKLFDRDEDIADVGWTRTIKKQDEGYSYSLFLSNLYELYISHKIAAVKPFFPRGLPRLGNENYFLLEDAVDWLQSEIGKTPQPFFGYFHFMPPHAPSTPRIEFNGRFANDGFQPPIKPQDVFSDHLPPDNLLRQRMAYDEYILYLDREFGRLFDHLETSGMLDNTWVVLTSDHGEMFERGFRGHGSPLLYQPVVRIPLLIFKPGQASRIDIHSATSAVDILPTLLHVTDENPVSWTEGTILPPFAPANPGRQIYSLNARHNNPNTALAHATAMLVKGRYKLTYFFGYPELGGEERVELYDIVSDPDELNDLYSVQKEIGLSLLDELKAKLREVNAPYT